MAPTGIPTGDGGVVSVDDDSSDGSDGDSGDVDAGGFGQELGGDPAGDADRGSGGGGGSDGGAGGGSSGGGGGSSAPPSSDTGGIFGDPAGSGGGEESPPGAGDETGFDDPDTGDMTTDRIRPDAESDPMNTQTQPTNVGAEQYYDELGVRPSDRPGRRQTDRVGGPSSGTGIPTGGYRGGFGGGRGGGGSDADRPDGDQSSPPVGDGPSSSPTGGQSGGDRPPNRGGGTDTGGGGTGGSDQPEDVINLTSHSSEYRPDVFDSPAEQERFLNLFEQQLRQESGNPDVVVAPGDVEYEDAESGGVRGSLDDAATQRIVGQAEEGSAVAKEQQAARAEAEQALETFMEGAVRPFAGQQQTPTQVVDLAGLGGDPAGRSEQSVSVPTGGYQTIRGGLTRQEDFLRQTAEDIEPDLRESGIEVDLVGTRDLRFDESGDIVLTEEGRERVEQAQADRPERYGDVEISNLGDLAMATRDVPFVGSVLGGAAAVFGPDAVSVSDLPSDVRLQTEPSVELAGGPGPPRTRQTQRVTGLEVDTFEEGTTLEDAWQSAEAEYSEFASGVGEYSTRLYGPQSLIDLAGEAGADEAGAERAFQSGVKQTVEFGNLPGLALTTKEAAEFAPYAAQEVSEGRGGVSVQVDQTEPEAGRISGAAGPLGVPETTRTSVVAIEEEGLAPDIGRDAQAAVREGVEYAKENPYEFGGGAAGSLISSVGIMGGAARLSRGAGLASRVAIQPGEELLGYGGYYSTRGVAGSRTADRLFPQKEPLIFSEEAAIRGAKRAGGAVRRGAGRARSRLRSEPERGQLNLVDLTRGLKTEAEVERSEAEEEALGPELDPFDYSDSRVYDPTRTFGETEGVGQTTDPTQAELPQDIGPGIGPRGEAGGFRGGTVEENFEAYLEESRGRGDAAQESFLETGQTTRPRYESTLATGPLSMEGLGFETISGSRASEDLVADTRADIEPGSDLRFDQEFKTEPFMEFRGEDELELETEWEPEWEFEYEGELEAEFEFEGEPELEFEPDDKPGRETEDPIIGRRPGWSRLVERDLLNPFTGE